MEIYEHAYSEDLWATFQGADFKQHGRSYRLEPEGTSKIGVLLLKGNNAILLYRITYDGATYTATLPDGRTTYGKNMFSCAMRMNHILHEIPELMEEITK